MPRYLQNSKFFRACGANKQNPNVIEFIIRNSFIHFECHIEFVNEVVTTVQNDDMRIDRVMTTMWYSFAGWIDQITVYTLSHGDTKVVVCTTITLERLVKSLNDLVCFGCYY